MRFTDTEEKASGMLVELGLSAPTTYPVPTFVRELDEGDVLRLENAVLGVEPPTLKRVGHRHHRLARLLASGLAPADVCVMTGYSQSRISILQNDPAFRELLAHYTEEVKVAMAEVVENMASLRNDAIGELSQRLEETPEAFSNRELLEVVNSMADRTGHGVQSKLNVSASVSVLTHEDLMRLKSEAQGRMIDVSSTILSEAQSGEGAGVGADIREGALESPPANSGPEKGHDVSTEGNPPTDPAVETPRP